MGAPNLITVIAVALSWFTLHATASGTTTWTRKYGDRADMPFSGITTFAHMPNAACLSDKSPFDIGIIGFPFDTAVSYRPGARFGPQAIRDGSRRLRASNGWSMHWKVNPYDRSVTLIDCGDVSISITPDATERASIGAYHTL